MGNHRAAMFYLFTCFLTLSISPLSNAIDEDRKVHIVYMGSLPEREYSPSSHHFTLLHEVTNGSSVENLLVRTYERSFNGFAAKLTNDEAQKLASRNEVVSVFPSRNLQLHTTRSWDFMGFFENTASRNLGAESNVTIGLFDTGIWPESPSFNDDGFGPPPKKWKGVCKGGHNFTCNNKIIGARSYLDETTSARDNVGHGTHTASTAAGNLVRDASFYGLARGMARGGVPRARIAVYGVCSEISCPDDAILAAFDDAIADGVDIITASLGLEIPVDITLDSISIGGFHSMEKGILTVQSGGNEGPEAGTVTSLGPWLLTVAASTTDRQIIDKLVLGNGETLIGSSTNSFTANGTMFPLIYGPDATTTQIAEPCAGPSCAGACFDRRLVKGKIVMCTAYSGYFELQEVGALGSILPGAEDDGSPMLPLPALVLSSDNYDLVKSYINSTKEPVASILKSETIKNSNAPRVASFSSRGPNKVMPDLMKPDVTAPGVDILAAFPPEVSPSGTDQDTRQVTYNLLSGTSMACPHVTGTVAYVKAAHPDWSPSAIKSAIMTTAWQMDASKNSDAEFAFGSGHVNPVKAISPGLVYDASKDDYIKLLCSLGYETKKLRSLSGDNSTCPKGANTNRTSPKHFNYPSLVAQVYRNQSFKIEFKRTVTNVGSSNSTYTAKINPNWQVAVEVVPQILSFKSLHEKKSFTVTVAGGPWTEVKVVSASLVWSDGIHNVRSPIVVYTGTKWA